MFKKLLFSFLTLLCAYNFAVVGYRIFEPRTEEVTDNEDYLDYDTLSAYIASSGENITHILFFYTADDTDSVYVKESLLKTTDQKTDVPLSSVVETVDVSELYIKDKLNQMKNDWGITSIPSFIAVTVKDGTPDVLSVLEQKDGRTFTEEELISWISEVSDLQKQN